MTGARDRAPRVHILALAAAFLAAACSVGGAGPEGGEIIIASDFPTSGADRASGRGAQAGVAYAIRLTPTIRGFRITHRPYDDAVNGADDPQRGAQNVMDMVNSTKVLGVVGPLSSSVARATIPVANRASLVMISPATTDDCLTQDFPYCDPKPAALRDPGQPNTYFRIAAPDVVQGQAMADFAYDTLKIARIAVWSDDGPFGRSVANSFTKRFQSRGGAVVVRGDFNATVTDFTPFLQRAKDAGAQGIYAGATSATQGCVPMGQSKGILDVPHLGPAGIGDARCIRDAGDQATNKMYFTSPIAVAAQSSVNSDLIEGFKRAFPAKDDLGAYTFAGYDSAKILLDAIGRAIDAAGGNMPTRAQVLEAVQRTDTLKLSTGTYTFDKNGDPISATMAVYQLRGSDWVFVRQFSVGQ